MKIKITEEYLQELQKLNESLLRLQERIEKHFSKIATGNEEKPKLLSRKECATYLGISQRQFDRKAKEWHMWRYHNNYGLCFNEADLKLSKEELKDKWIKGFLTKKIDAKGNVLIETNPLYYGKNKKIVDEILKTQK